MKEDLKNEDKKRKGLNVYVHAIVDITLAVPLLLCLTMKMWRVTSIMRELETMLICAFGRRHLLFIHRY